MKQIPLTQGKAALVDDEDYERLMEMGKWQYSAQGYATTDVWENKKNVKVSMHRVIMNTPKGEYIDHINNNKIDNQKANLRECKQHQNCANRGVNKNNTSGFKGVTFDKRKNKWSAKIQVRRKYLFCGYGNTPEEAALKYNVFAERHFGEFAVLNKVNL